MTFIHQRTLTGIGWSSISQVIKQVLAFSIAVILARLLSPREFGLLAMVIVFTGFIDVFTDMGLGAAIIQKPDLEPRHVNAVFWANTGVGVLLTVLVIMAAPLIALFFRLPALRLMTTVLAFNFLVGSFRVVQESLLLRQMEFRRLAIVDNVSVLVSGCGAIGLALAGMGVWSLVGQSILSALTSVLVLWSLAKWRPTSAIDWKALRELLPYSSGMLGFNAVNYWIRNIDNILIGRFIGSTALGIYGRAYALMLFPINQIASALGKVMFPALSAIQEDRDEVRGLYLRITGIISLITFPLMTGLLVVAKPFVLTLFGGKWAEVIPVFRILCVTGLIQSVGTTVGWIYTSQGNTRLMFRWSVGAGLIFGVGIAAGLNWGVKGVAWAYTICNILLLYPAWTLPGRLINLTFFEMVKNVSGTFFCAVLMGGAVYASATLMPPDWPDGLLLLVQVLCGLVVYALLVHLLKLAPYRNAREMFRGRMKMRLKV